MTSQWEYKQLQTEGEMRMNKKRLLWGGIILVVLAMVVYGYLGKTQTVETVKLQTGSISARINETGYVQTVNDFEVQATQSGYINGIDAAIGDQVKPGQVLMRLDNSDLQISRTSAESQQAQSQAQLTVARQSLAGYRIEADSTAKDLQRTEQLFAAGAATQAELDEARSAMQSLQEKIDHQQQYIADLQRQVDLGREQVAEINQKAEQLTIVSPVAGTILDLPLKSGAYVNMGTLVAQIGTPEKLEVQADILDEQMGDIAAGQKVYISAAVLGEKELTGQVQTIRPRAFTKVSALGVEQRRVPVIIALDSTGKLKPAYEVEVSIETAAKNGILVLPREAIRSNEGQDQVLKIVDGKIKHQDIKTGLSDEDKIEILTGLKAGDLIVRDASEDIPDGTKVKFK